MNNGAMQRPGVAANVRSKRNAASLDEAHQERKEALREARKARRRTTLNTALLAILAAASQGIDASQIIEWAALLI